MYDFLRRSTNPEISDLVEVIRQIRRRWRFKLALRGVVLVAAFVVAALVGAAFGLESWRFSPGSILTFRVLLSVAFAATIGLLLVRPLLRRVSDEQVALYLEEHEPSLQAEIISAVEAEAQSRRSGAPASPLVRRLVESAVEKVRALEHGRRLERGQLRRYAGAFALIAAAAVAIFTLGPAFMRHALSALLVVSRSVEAAVPYRIEVTPGNVTLPRGADQTITASLMGFDSDQAALMVRKTADAPFEKMPLVRAGNRYEAMLFDLATPLDYFVEAGGVRSTTYTLKVVDLPYVQKLELEYHFPAYTGLAPRKIEDGGDIAVLSGTEVRVRIVPTMTAKGGQVVLHDKASAALAAAADGSFTTSFKADRDGFYRVELDAPTGERVTASPQYTIDVLTDQSPVVSISKPGRDTTASPIEEVFVEASAEDDFGVRDLELVYSVNGGAEKTVRLFDGKSRLPEVSAGHTFYFEELGVQPGDFVSYFARAADNDGVAGPKRASSDLYFVQVRPLKKEFRRAESQAGGGWGRRRRRSWCALSATAANHLGNVQRPARSQDDERRQAEGELGRGRLGPGPLAGTGRGTLDADEQPVGRAGSRVQKDRRAAAAGGDADDGRRGQAPRPRSTGCIGARTESASGFAEGGGGVRAPGKHAARWAAAVAVRARWLRIWPICSSSSSIAWRTSTKRLNARAIRTPIRSSMSSWRS